MGSQALKGNVTSWGEGLGYFGVGAAAGALYLTPGGQAAAGSVQVIGNKGIQIATGKFDVTEVNSVGDVATLGLDIATDYFSVAPAAKLGSNLASGLQKLAGSYVPSVASGGGSVIKTGVGGTVDDITFSVSLSDEVVVSASKVGGKGVAARSSTATARSLGIAGERAVGITGPKTAINVAGRTRIPDAMTRTTLTEVKNVKSLSFTKQLRDFHSFSGQTGRDFILYTRPNTTLSGPLQNAINQGTIIHRYIPFR